MGEDKLTDEEHELLTMLIEEASEVIKAATKIKRHGWLSMNPDIHTSDNNKDELLRELHDLDIVRRMVWLCSEVETNPDFITTEDIRRKLRYSHKLEIPKYLK